MFVNCCGLSASLAAHSALVKVSLTRSQHLEPLRSRHDGDQGPAVVLTETDDPIGALRSIENDKAGGELHVGEFDGPVAGPEDLLIEEGDGLEGWSGREGVEICVVLQGFGGVEEAHVCPVDELQIGASAQILDRELSVDCVSDLAQTALLITFQDLVRLHRIDEHEVVTVKKGCPILLPPLRPGEGGVGDEREDSASTDGAFGQDALRAEGEQVHLVDALAVVGGGDQQDVVGPHEDADILEAKSGGVARCIWQFDVPVTVGGEGVQEVLCDDGLLNVGGERVGAAAHAGVEGASEEALWWCRAPPNRFVGEYPQTWAPG